MTREEAETYISPIVEGFREAFERGEIISLVQATRFCLAFGLPIPNWAADGVERAMIFYSENGGADGKGKTGRFSVQQRRDRIHRIRHQIAEHELARRDSIGGNRRDAFERASGRLSGTIAQGSSDAIENSFNKIQARYRTD